MLRVLIEYCVHRRVAVLVFALCIVAFGVRAYLATAIEAYPDVTNAQVTVITQMQGYAPEEIERQITFPIERVLNGTPELLQMRSESLFGLSLITLIFDDKADSFRSRAIVAQRVHEVELPEGVAPTLAPDATPLGEIYQFRLSSDRHSLYEVRSEMEWTVTRILRQVPGVADSLAFGGYLTELHVEVDPARLEAYGLTLVEVLEALKRSNMNVGGGFLAHGDQELMIRGIGFLRSPEDLKKVVLRSEQGTPVTVGDVARVIQSYTPRRGAVGWNGEKEAVEGFALLRRGQNPSQVLEGIHAKVAELNARILPKGMHIEPVIDRSELVANTLHTVHHNLLLGFALVVGLVWLFLRSLRCALIVGVVIPLSLLVAFIGLYLMDLPANLISMGAIDFGILLDGAVVLVEHVIHQAQQQRPDSQRRLLHLIADAAVDVSQPTFYAMMIIIAALLPVFTLERVEGRIFRPLALTYSFALSGALVFSLSVVPGLCALLLKPKHVNITEPGFVARARAVYERVLGWTLAHRAGVVGVAFFMLGMSALGASRLGTEFLPELDEGDIHVFVEMPSSIRLQKGQAILLEMRQRLLKFPEVLQIMSEEGRPEDGTDNEEVNMSETYVHVRPRSEWRAGLGKEDLVHVMREALADIPGVRFNFSQPIKDNVEESVSGVRGKIVLKIFGSDLELMRTALLQAKDAIKGVAGVIDLNLYRETSIPQLQINLDRSALAREGISVETAEAVVETALGGRIVTEWWDRGRPVPVRVRLPRADTEDAARVAGILVPAPSGARIPLSDLASMDTAVGRASISREANSRYLALKFNVEGRDMGSVVEDAMAVVADKVKVPEGHFLVWGGEFENQQRAMARLRIIVPIALVIVMGLLYSALQSGISTAVIIASVPFALTGGLFALLLTGIPLSVSAAIGFIALLGQVSLMGLLVLTAIEQCRRAGGELQGSILEGATARLRAVWMASLLAMLGLMPMALSTAVGSETQKPFAVVIVGGMLTTFLVATLLVPVIYSLVTPKRLLTPEQLDEIA
jgi:heavy metal efflux system protein